LIIPGSGPTDRDGNNPLGVTASTYRLLAEGLAERGVTSIRIDKRGLFSSAAAVPDANKVTIEDYAADIRSWAGAIRARTGAACIWLLGHSEGGLVALAAARDANICGLLLVSAPGRPVGPVLREQLRANPANAPLLDEAMAAIDALEAKRPVDTAGMNPALRPLFAPQVQGFLISLLAYDPAKLLAGYEKPVLILQGLRDIQVTEQDARRLKDAHPGARLVLLADANHVLKPVSSADRGANIATYSDPGLPLAAGVVPAIADFIGPPAAFRSNGGR
jgi:pimeloyl-ACP methyl ester carboxylesterase